MPRQDTINNPAAQNRSVPPSTKDAAWPLCKCGHIAQEHNLPGDETAQITGQTCGGMRKSVTGGNSYWPCKCKGYEPVTDLTPWQREQMELRRRQLQPPTTGEFLDTIRLTRLNSEILTTEESVKDLMTQLTGFKLGVRNAAADYISEPTPEKLTLAVKALVDCQECADAYNSKRWHLERLRACNLDKTKDEEVTEKSR